MGQGKTGQGEMGQGKTRKGEMGQGKTGKSELGQGKRDKALQEKSVTKKGELGRSCHRIGT